MIKLFIFEAFDLSIASMAENFWLEDYPIAFLLIYSLGATRAATS